MLRVILAVSVLTLICIPANPQSTDVVDGQSKLDALAWLAGHWVCEQDGRVTEEIWMPPSGTIMPGVNRSVGPSNQTAFEYMRMAETDGQLAFYASPNGKPETPFQLIAVDETSATFENSNHDFPQRVIYRLDGDRLIGRIEGTINGQQRSLEWHFEKAE